MAIESLSRNQETAWRERHLPQVEQVAEGTWAIPVPIPNNPLVYTYCYALAEDSGVSLIDPGWDGAEQLEALTSGLASIGYSLSEVNGVAITHYHRDHIGLVPAIVAANSDIWLAIHGQDLKSLRSFRDRQKSMRTGAAVGHDVAAEYGVPAERRAEINGPSPKDRAKNSAKDKKDKAGRPSSYQVPAMPEGITLLADGSPLPLSGRTVTGMWTPGHTYGHTSFRETNSSGELFYSGDHVLPTITPNIGLDSGFLTHSLANYLASLQRMSELGADTTVLPAHGFRFTGLRDRATEIADHHATRLDEVRARAAETDDHSVYSIAQGMHWARGFEALHDFNLYAALAETAAHMYYLDMPVGGHAVSDETPDRLDVEL